MSEWSYVAAAYGVTWLVLAGYVAYVHGRVRRARRLLERSAGGAEVGR